MWTRAIGGTGFQVAYHLRADRGEFRVTGYGFTGRERDHDGFTLRVRAQGAIVRHEPFGGEDDDRATQCVVLEDAIAVGYSRPADAADDQLVWHTVLYGLDRNGKPTWTRRLEGEGLQSGHDIARHREQVWAVGQVSENGTSRVQVARLTLPARTTRR